MKKRLFVSFITIALVLLYVLHFSSPILVFAIQSYELVKTPSAGSMDGITITGVGAGDFDPNKLKVWHYDKNNPQIIAIPGGEANIYAANLVKNGGAWALYYGGWDGSTDLLDRIYFTVSYSGLNKENAVPWGTRYTIMDHDYYLLVNDPSVVNKSPGDWSMAYILPHVLSIKATQQIRANPTGIIPF